MTFPIFFKKDELYQLTVIGEITRQTIDLHSPTIPTEAITMIYTRAFIWVTSIRVSLDSIINLLIFLRGAFNTIDMCDNILRITCSH